MDEKSSEATPLVGKYERKRSCLSSITVEPGLFLTAFGFGLESIFSTNLWVDKICYNQFGYGKEVCTNLDSGRYTQQQDNVQRVVNDYTIYKQVIEYIPALVAVLLLGSWSDRRGRRLPVILPVFGQLLMALALTANSYWWSLAPPFLLLAYIPVGITGSLVGMFMGAYAYVSVSSGRRARTSRVTLVGVMMLLGLPLGQAMGTVFFKAGGYVLVFGIQSGLTAVAVVYLLLRLERLPGGGGGGGGGGEGEEAKGDSLCNVLSPSHIKETLMVVARPRERKGRPHVLGHITNCCLVVFSYTLYGYDFLFTRKKFSWDINRYTIWSAIDNPLSALGTLVVMPLLSYRFGMDDTVLAFIGAVSMIFTYVIRGTAPVSWVLYVASLVGIPRGMAILGARAAASKLVEKEELGAVFAVLAAGETVIPVASAFIYTAIYNASLDTFPGGIYLFTAGISVIVCCINVWILTSQEPPNTYSRI